MSKLYNVLNISSDKEFEQLVESLNLDDNQYINFMTAVSSDLSEDGYKYILENLTKSFGNGSYEKLQEQFSKEKSCGKRELKKVEEDTVYDHSWYEVKGQKYPKRTKEGVIIKESYDEPIYVWNYELRKNPYISREEIFKAKEIFFKEICDHADEYPNFKELVKVLQTLLDKGLINDKQYKFCRTNWDDLFGEYDPDVYGDSDITESVIKESFEPWEGTDTEIIGTDESRDFKYKGCKIFTSTSSDEFDEYGNEITIFNATVVLRDGTTEEFRNDGWQDLCSEVTNYIDEQLGDTEFKMPKPETEPETDGDELNESKEPVETEIETEEVIEEKPESTEDPELAKFIDQTEKVVDNTTNADILQGLLASVEAKLPLASDV